MVVDVGGSPHKSVVDADAAHVDAEHGEEPYLAPREGHFRLDAYRATVCLHQRQAEHLRRDCLLLHLVAVVVEEQEVDPRSCLEGKGSNHIILVAHLHAGFKSLCIGVGGIVDHKLGSTLIAHAEDWGDDGHVGGVAVVHLLGMVGREGEGQA